MSTTDRIKIIVALAEARMTTVEQMQAVSLLFTKNMNGFDRTIIIKALGQCNITMPEEIKAFLKEIQENAERLFPKDMG